MLEFKEGFYYYSIWFVDLPAQKQDSLACLFRDDKGELITRWRIRYIKEPDPWSEKDEKKWWDINHHGDGDDPEGVREKLNTMWRLAAYVARGSVDHLKIDGDHMKALEALKSRPWAHLKEAN
jgi:hypothetical protein